MKYKINILLSNTKFMLLNDGTFTLRNYFLTLFLIILFGCSSAGEININQPLNSTIDHQEIAAIQVVPDDGLDSKDESVIEVTQRLKGELFGRLVSEGIFRQVVHVGDEAKYLLNVRLVDAHEVSQGSRLWWGFLAGANSLAVTVQIIDSSSSEVPIMDFVVKGTSASHPISSESDMDDAIREVVDEIILALR